MKTFLKKVVRSIFPESHTPNNHNNVEINLRAIIKYINLLNYISQDIEANGIKKSHFRLISEYLLFSESIELKFRAKNKQLSQAKQKYFTDAYLNFQYAKLAIKPEEYLKIARDNFGAILLLSEESKNFSSIDSREIISEIFDYDSKEFDPEIAIAILVIYLGWATCKSLLQQF